MKVSAVATILDNNPGTITLDNYYDTHSYSQLLLASMGMFVSNYEVAQAKKIIELRKARKVVSYGREKSREKVNNLSKVA